MLVVLEQLADRSEDTREKWTLEDFRSYTISLPFSSGPVLGRAKRRQALLMNRKSSSLTQTVQTQ
jgi:hypothetical protein